MQSSRLCTASDGYQRLAGNEGRELTGGQLVGAGIQPGRVGGQEQVAGVAVKLGVAGWVQRVFDGQRVQAELLAQHGEIILVGLIGPMEYAATISWHREPAAFAKPDGGGVIVVSSLQSGSPASGVHQGFVIATGPG
jgi:hypothetical protein